MKWFTDVVIEGKVMVEEEVFTRDVRSQGVIEDVIRLRGGFTTRSGRTNERLPSRTEDMLVARTFMRAFRVDDQPSPSSMSASSDTNRVFKVNSLMYTAYRYHMHPLVWCANSNQIDIAQVGIGPALFWATHEEYVSGGAPFANTGKLRPYTTPNNIIAGVRSCNSPNGIIYVFSADWFGAEMQVDPKHQIATSDPNNRLGWAASETTITTDPNIPITYANIASNKDWSRIRHYCTYITFDMNNLAPYPYVVEIMFFKFIVDPNDLTYNDMQTAPFCMQYDQLHSYCSNGINQFGTPQIKVIKKKRLVLRGLDNYSVLSDAGLTNSSGYMNANIVKSNSASYKFKISRMYDIVRGIKQQPITLSETTLFNQFYDANDGIYCRVQAWPLNTFYTGSATTATTNVANPIINNAYDTACQSTIVKSLTVLKPAVQIFMEKRSFIKLDSAMLKGPFQNS